MISTRTRIALLLRSGAMDGQVRRVTISLGGKVRVAPEVRRQAHRAAYLG
eukprot:COSAG01_NODE_1690_length_9443_cov_19.011078_5_plen_50_part_00